MRPLFKSIAVLIVIILIVSSVYAVFFIESGCGNRPIIDRYDEGDENGSENGNENGGDGNETEHQEFVHSVFIEEGTATWCENCPPIAGILNDLYKTGEYNFYYVSMIEDKNEKAHGHLYDDYNIYGFPTVFIDGGYKVFVGGDKKTSEFSDAIRAAETREVPEIRVTVKAEYDDTTSEINTEVLVENNETENYTGVLKVYLTEIISRWINHHSEAPKPYHYGFIDYVINKEITVDADDNTTFSVTKGLSDFPFSDLDPENLMVIAVVFNSESIKKYAYPPDENPFDAHFADATDATRVVEGGNLPPSVAICNPSDGKLHILGYPIMKTLKRNTILIGKSKITLCIEDVPGLKKVEFYIDGKLRYTDTEEPYEWSFRKVGLIKQIIRRHTLMIKGYNDKGKSATDSIDVITFFL